MSLDLDVSVEMSRTWDGAEAGNWADLVGHHDTTVQYHHELLLDAAGITATDVVLDVGCGIGDTTRAAATLATRGRAHGIDLSSRMIHDAIERALHLGTTNATFRVGDAQIHPFRPAEYDVVISRFGLMFFADPSAAFTNLRQALRPGGRLVTVAWRTVEGNQWVRSVFDALEAGRDLPRPVAGVPGPFGLADEIRTRTILVGAGFDRVEIERRDLPFRVGRDAAEAFEWFASTGIVRRLVADVGLPERVDVLDRLRRAIDGWSGLEGVYAGSSASLIIAS